MSMTFQANVDFSTVEKVKVYMKDLYPDSEDYYFEDDPYVSKEEGTGLLYQMDYAPLDFVHEITLSNQNMFSMLEVIDKSLAIATEHNDYCYRIESKDLPAFKQKIIRALNSEKSKKHAVPDFREGNMYHCGISESYIMSKLKTMLEITDNAQKRGLEVYWAW